jgi:hypothetical protein
MSILCNRVLLLVEILQLGMAKQSAVHLATSELGAAKAGYCC